MGSVKDNLVQRVAHFETSALQCYDLFGELHDDWVLGPLESRTITKNIENYFEKPPTAGCICMRSESSSYIIAT